MSTISDDDDDNVAVSAKRPTREGEEEEVDALDAFMMGVESELKEEPKPSESNAQTPVPQGTSEFFESKSTIDFRTNQSGETQNKQKSKKVRNKKIEMEEVSLLM